MVATGRELIGTQVGKYVLTRLLGTGGMGEVFEAEHRFLGARVAIKVVGSGALDDRRLLELFYQEARALSAIDHEGIVDVFDLEVLDDGRPCIIMEYLEGASLDKLIHERGCIRPDILIRWMIGWVDALAAAHQAGVVHRDLKPGNLFVTRTGRTEVLDFGVVKLMANNRDSGKFRSLAGEVFGTRPYMAPEQACGEPVDVRTDVFSLGVVMYEALTGKRPFKGKTLVALLVEHRRGLPPVSARRPVPTIVDQLVMKALEADQADRYQSLGELAEALATAGRALGVSRSRRESAPPGRYFRNLDDPTSGPITETDPRHELPTVRGAAPNR
ncbi:MAG: serine/threonine protein kinase, partial [Deltaproteobacteria bacterium]|nr:serine/threonine protein kinase [Deltaproteobacteria bacterium]